MRLFVVKAPTTAEDLRRRLGRTAVTQTLDDIARLNPHVDLRAVAPGTVLVIPDPPNADTKETTTVSEGQFEELRNQIADALKATDSRVRLGYETLAAQAKEATAAFKSAAVKRAVTADTALKDQVAAAIAVFKQDAAHAKAADHALTAIQKQSASDLDVLQKLLG